MIALSDINYSYDASIDIIKGLTLDISKNTSVAIVGNSGCGKTTLLNIISGAISPQKGQVRISASSMSYLMQDVTLLPYKTTFENALLAFELRNKVIDEDIKQRANDLLQLFQIKDDSFGKYPSELSGGMKQRIGLVQTLLTDSELLLLDEPFNAIDVNALEVIESYIWDYIKRGLRTMVIITHNIEQALLLCDRIIIMSNNHELHYINPSDDFIALAPNKRANNVEFKKLFFDVLEIMRP